MAYIVKQEAVFITVKLAQIDYNGPKASINERSTLITQTTTALLSILFYTIYRLITAVVGIRTAGLWCQNWPPCQLCHNHCYWSCFSSLWCCCCSRCSLYLLLLLSMLLSLIWFVCYWCCCYCCWNCLMLLPMLLLLLFTLIHGGKDKGEKWIVFFSANLERMRGVKLSAMTSDHCVALTDRRFLQQQGLNQAYFLAVGWERSSLTHWYDVK